MHTIAESLNQRQLSTGLKQLKPTVQLSTEEKKEQAMLCDIALAEYDDLISQSFKAWYCKAFYAIGKERFGILAAQARADGINKPKLFSSLLKKEMNR